MIETVTVHSIEAAFAFGFFAGLGWTIAAWLINHVLRYFP